MATPGRQQGILQMDPAASPPPPPAPAGGPSTLIPKGNPGLHFSLLAVLPERGHQTALPAYREQEGGHGCQELRVDHGEHRGQVALSGPHKEQPVDRKAGGQLHPSSPGRVGSRGCPCPSTGLPDGCLLVSLADSLATGKLRGLAHFQSLSPKAGCTTNPQKSLRGHNS